MRHKNRTGHGVGVSRVPAARDVDRREVRNQGKLGIERRADGGFADVRIEVDAHGRSYRAWQKSGGKKKRASRGRDTLLPAVRLPSTITAPLP